jgi:hypothetical protein
MLSGYPPAGVRGANNLPSSFSHLTGKQKRVKISNPPTRFAGWKRVRGRNRKFGGTQVNFQLAPMTGDAE